MGISVFRKSPLRYPGGKSRAAKLITSLIPDFDEFREPFVGGGSIYLTTKQQYPNKEYWINDIYFELYNFWDFAQKDMRYLAEKVEFWLNEFDDGKILYYFLNENFNDFNDLDKAAAFFVYNRITFSGTTLSGGYSDAAYKGRFTASSIDRLRKIEPIIHNTKITNFDYSVLLEHPGDNVFIFLDPPYHAAEKSALYGKNGNLHKGFDHEAFANSLKSCSHKWLITYDDSEYIRSLFCDFAHIYNWDLVYGMRNVSKDSEQTGKEVFISNYLDNRSDVESLINSNKKKTKKQ